MKSFLFSCSVGLFFSGVSLYSACAKADTASAYTLTHAEMGYCSEWADAHYHGPRDKRTNAPDESNPAFIAAQDSCEMQWKIVAVQWDEPAYMNEIAVMAIAAGTAEGMDYAEAQAIAKKYGAKGVEQVGQDLWIPMDSDTHPGTVGGAIPFK